MGADNVSTKSGRFMFAVAWLLFFALILLFFHYFQKRETKYQIKAGNLIITADKEGHYFVDGAINEHPVKFLVDTGATLVAIPKSVADSINLKGRYTVSINVAGGQIEGTLTRINKLSFGNFTLYDVKGVIFSDKAQDSIVLLGINVLAQFSLSQQAGKLTFTKD